MKKLFILFIGISSLTSCSSDDNKNNSINAPIVGEWTLTKLNSEMNLAGGIMQSRGEGKEYNAFMTFTELPNQVSSGGTVILDQTIYMNGTPLSTNEDLINLENTFGTGEWELLGNTLTMSRQDSSVSVTVTKLTSNTLIFRYAPDETISIIYQFSK